MEVFSACVKKSIAGGNFSYHWRTKKADISHLIFADDAMLFCKGNKESIQCLYKGISMFSMFSDISGLKPNPSKCQCFFGNVNADVIQFKADLTGFQPSSLPIKYLGFQLITSRLNVVDCAPLVMRLCVRIDIWTIKFMCIAGRLQLLKSVLFGIQNHWSMYLFLPKSVLKGLKLFCLIFCGVVSIILQLCTKSLGRNIVFQSVKVG